MNKYLEPPLPLRVDIDSRFVQAGVLDAVDIAFAEFIDRMLGDAITGVKRQRVLLAAALASRAPRRGHVGVELASVARTTIVDAGTRRVDADGTPAIADLPWPDPHRWIRDFPVRGSLGDACSSQPELDSESRRPLVWERGMLYMERYHYFEGAVAKHLRRLAAPSTIRPVEPVVPGLDRAQRRAVAASLEHNLTVIAGGPGSGKTFTIAALLATYLSIAPDARVGLAAPTGKAASRMKEAIDATAAELGGDHHGRLRDLSASTVHRLLGYRGGSDFVHTESNRLGLDLLVIDEVSMMSVPLMAHLLDAIDDETKIVLVGDPNQLASVEAGAVLADIVAASGTWRDRSVVQLERVHRFGEDSGIARLAAAINAGDAAAALRLLGDPSVEDVALIDPADPDGSERLERLGADLVVDGVEALRQAAAGDARSAMAQLSSTKVLCATRLGPNGREAWQRQIETAVRAAVEGAHFAGRWYVGRPIIVTGNDYLLQLFNGDTGVVVREGGARKVSFPAVTVADDGSGERDERNSGTRLVDPTQLSDHETWWAMTIHKSQGSQFDHAVVALPEVGSPILTRQLLYTAVTRARSLVTIVGSEESVRAAIETSIVRATGLSRQLSSNI